MFARDCRSQICPDSLLHPSADAAVVVQRKEPPEEGKGELNRINQVAIDVSLRNANSNLSTAASWMRLI